MKKFVATLVIASVYAQEKTVSEEADESWSSVKNWFAAVTQEYLTTYSKQTPMGSYIEENEASMNSTISLDFTAIGTNFVTVTMNLTHPKASYFAEKTRGLVYFQIEEPANNKRDDTRLLQVESTA